MSSCQEYVYLHNLKTISVTYSKDVWVFCFDMCFFRTLELIRLKYGLYENQALLIYLSLYSTLPLPYIQFDQVYVCVT